MSWVTIGVGIGGDLGDMHARAARRRSLNGEGLGEAAAQVGVTFAIEGEARASLGRTLARALAASKAVLTTWATRTEDLR